MLRVFSLLRVANVGVAGAAGASSSAWSHVWDSFLCSASWQVAKKLQNIYRECGGGKSIGKPRCCLAVESAGSGNILTTTVHSVFSSLRNTHLTSTERNDPAKQTPARGLFTMNTSRRIQLAATGRSPRRKHLLSGEQLQRARPKPPTAPVVPRSERRR